MKRAMLFWFAVTIAGAMLANYTVEASDVSTQIPATEVPINSSYCTSRGGIDITDKGNLVLGDRSGSAVVCQFPNRVFNVHPSIMTNVGGLPPLTSLNATFELPSGTRSLANGQQFSTACIADLSYAPSQYVNPTSHGMATFNCTGYNYGSESLGCNIQWSGPVDIVAGPNPGGQAVAAFTCIITKIQAIPFYSSFTYKDPLNPNLGYWTDRMPSSINVTP